MQVEFDHCDLFDYDNAVFPVKGGRCVLTKESLVRVMSLFVVDQENLIVVGRVMQAMKTNHHKIYEGA